MGEDIRGGTEPRMDVSNVKRTCCGAGLQVWVLVKMGSGACGTRVDILAEGNTWTANGCGECL